MATVEQIAEVRLLTAEPDQDFYTDADLNGQIDAASGNLDLVARDIWLEKAARYVAIVDISEAGSSRSNSVLHARAMQMVAFFEKRLDDAAAAIAVTGVRVS